MTKLILTLGFSLVTALTALGAGSMTINGKAHSFSKESFEIADDINIYSISKKRLSSQQLKSLEASTVGSKTQITVNFDAIIEVRKIKKN